MKKTLLLLLPVCVSFNLFAQIPTNGLIGYWPLNGNANDSSGNGYNGVVTNATLTTDRFGNANAAYFFGDPTKYITVADAAPLRLGNTDFSISLWMNQNSILSNQEALLTKRGTGSQSGYILNVTGVFAPTQGLINYQVSGGLDPKVQSDSIPSLNTWHHVAVIYTLSNQRLQIYVDGIKQADTTGIPAPDASNATSLYFGNDQPNGQYAFHGKMDDIALYNRALSFPEIHQIYAPCDTIDIAGNIIAKYNFTGNADDDSGNNYNGTVSGAILTTDRFGNANNAYLFDGTAATIAVADQTALRLSNTAFTISSWVNQSTAVANVAAILSKRSASSGQQGYIFNIGGTSSIPPGRLTFNVSGGTDPKAVSDSAVSVNAWHHVAVTYDLSSETMNTYIDGLINNTQAGIPSPNGTILSVMYIGSDAAGNPYFFNGKIDDIIIYSRSLTACDIDSLYHLPNPATSGIHNLTADSKVKLYPDPAKDYFMITGLQHGKISISNAYGQVLKSITITGVTDKVTIAELPSGLYFVNISIDPQHVLVKKIIKY